MTGDILIRGVSIHALLQQRIWLASSIAVAVHMVGLVGMIAIDLGWFSSMTPVNLLLMSLLLIWTQESKGFVFFIFMTTAFCVGMAAEIIGVNTGILFGQYTYGKVMGFKVAGVPLIIGMNWFVVTLCAAATMQWLTRFICTFKQRGKKRKSSGLAETIFMIPGTALLAVMFDWILEPAAVRLGFWTWDAAGTIPVLNYLSWFLVSFLLLSIMRLLRVRLENLFAVHLFIIQSLFFLGIRLFVR